MSNATRLVEQLTNAIADAPAPNHEENDYNAGYVAGLDYVRSLASAVPVGEHLAERDALAQTIRTVDGNHDMSAANLADALHAAGYRKVPAPDVDNPTPALIEAAYIAQDDLSTPPDREMLGITAEIVDSYLGALEHKTVHVLGHAQNVAEAEQARA